MEGKVCVVTGGAVSGYRLCDTPEVSETLLPFPFSLFLFAMASNLRGMASNLGARDL